MSGTIFYSWQNDLDHKTHRYFIENCINNAIKTLKKDVQIIVDYDRDTKGLNGSPDITESIFNKIDKSSLFICDISIINQNDSSRKTPNPNVLIELGYAVHKLGWDRIICFFDSATGDVEDLPFDIRQKRITTFNPNNDGEKERMAKILIENIKDLYIKGKLFNPLNDYMKGRIDRSLLAVAKQMANLVFGTITMSDGLSKVPDLLNSTKEEITENLNNAQFPAFIVLNTYSEEENNLKLILRELLSSSYFPKEWSYTVLELLDWIREYNFLISKRNPTFPFVIVDGIDYKNFAAIHGKSVNSQSAENTYLVIETYDEGGSRYVDTEGGNVINTTNYPTHHAPSLRKCFKIKPEMVSTFSLAILSFNNICNDWLNSTDEEFILDPDYYLIT